MEGQSGAGAANSPLIAPFMVYQPFTEKEGMASMNQEARAMF
jgi:hypothetical protein